jgi:dTMP kinase
MSKGLFITLEGGEGSGKTTQIKLLRSALEAIGKTVVVTREPGGSPLAEKIRQLLLNPDFSEINYKTEFLLFLAARAQHIKDTIAPALKEGSTVICDRYLDSSFVYQHYARGIVSNKEFVEMNTWTITHEHKEYYPDITLMLDIDVEVGHQRALNRNNHLKDQSEARFDNEERAFHEKVNQGYRERAAINPIRIRVVNANQDLRMVHEDICKTINEVVRSWKIHPLDGHEI